MLVVYGIIDHHVRWQSDQIKHYLFQRNHAPIYYDQMSVVLAGIKPPIKPLIF